MLNPGNSYHLRVERYPYNAMDNGCFGDKFDEDKWMDRLAMLAESEAARRCLFAVAPDVYPDAEASLERGLPFCPIIREMGLPAAIVAQDGAEDIDYPWEEFDAIFIGGARTENPDDEWKISQAAAEVVAEARSHGLWTHMGRVNSWERIEKAHRMGCQSVDGTYIKYRKRHRAGEGEDERHARGENELHRWTTSVAAQPTLWRHEGPSHPNHRVLV